MGTTSVPSSLGQSHHSSSSGECVSAWGPALGQGINRESSPLPSLPLPPMPRAIGQCGKYHGQPGGHCAAAASRMPPQCARGCVCALVLERGGSGERVHAAA
jgi:hypothetical protein